MSKSAVISFRVDEETLATLDRLAEAQGRSRAWFAERATRDAVQREAAYLAFVQAGIDAADRGDLIPQDDVFRAIRASRDTSAGS